MKSIPTPPTIRAGLSLLTPVNAWATDDGYIVAQVEDGHMGGFWVRDKTDRWSQHLTMADAEADIAWLRTHNR